MRQPLQDPRQLPTQPLDLKELPLVEAGRIGQRKPGQKIATIELHRRC